MILSKMNLKRDVEHGDTGVANSRGFKEGVSFAL